MKSRILKLKFNGEKGISLIEALVSVAILGGVVLTMILALSGGTLAVNANDQQVTAQILARAELEYVKDLAYNPGAATYPAVDVPEGYSITVGVDPVPDAGTDIQKVTADIYHDGALELSVSEYKVNR